MLRGILIYYWSVSVLFTGDRREIGFIRESLPLDSLRFIGVVTTDWDVIDSVCFISVGYYFLGIKRGWMAGFILVSLLTSGYIFFNTST